MNSFGCVLFLLHCHGITGSIATFMFKKKPVKVNDILDLQSYFPESKSRSPVECSRSCSKVDGCISLIFDKKSRECRIFKSDIAEKKRGEKRDVDKETQWVYYHIIKGMLHFIHVKSRLFRIVKLKSYFFNFHHLLKTGYPGTMLISFFFL